MTLPLPGRGSSGHRFILELFVILCLSVCYFVLVRNFALGVGNNYTNSWVFKACAQSDYHLSQLGDVWKGRLSSFLLSGSLFDLAVKEDGSYLSAHYASIFGLYHAFWLLILLLTIRVAVRESILVNLAIFAGLLWNFSPATGLYFYPWDLPSTVFFTLAVLLHARQRWALMMASICAGCFFKETVLVAAILPLLTRQWKWPWRILAFAGLVGFFVLGKRLLLDSLHFQTAVLSMDNATSLWQLLRPTILLDNLHLLFSRQAPHLLLANSGTLLAVLALGWAKRFRPYMWVMMVFLAGQFMYGAFNEVRIFMQLLPLSCLILSEYVRASAARSAGAAECVQPDGGPAKQDEPWAGRKNGAGLIVLTVMLLAVSSSLVVWEYYSLLQSLRPVQQARAAAALRVRAERGEPTAQYALGNRYSKGLGVATNRQDAFHWFGQAAERGHQGAQLALGSSYLRGEGTPQSYEAAIHWFQIVAAQGNQESRFYLDLSYVGVFGLGREMANRFQYLAWLGPAVLALAGFAIVASFFLGWKTMFDPAVWMALGLALGTLIWRWGCGGDAALWRSTPARDPNCYFAHHDLGYAHYINGQFDKAIAIYRRGVALQPDFADAHNDLGNALFKTRRLDEAVSCYQKALEFHSNNAITHCNLGFAFSAKGSVDEAIAQFQKAVALEPDNALFHSHLAGELLQKGRADEAIAQFQKVVELAPADTMAHNNLGVVLAQTGQLDRAIGHFQEALRLQPDNADARRNLAAALRLKESTLKQPTP